MDKRQTRPLTPAEAVRQGRKLIAERRRQEAARKAAMQPEVIAQPEPISAPICQPAATGQGGVEAEAGKPVPEQDQRLTGGSLRHSAASSTRAEAPAADPTIIFAATIVSPEINKPPARLNKIVDSLKADHQPGTWPIADLRAGQCRFACTADDAPRDQHRFCGRPTRVGRSNLHGSWCDEHLARVWGDGSMAERVAHQPTRRMFG
ncbi:hypothetical protein [Methylorubrum aminovorans]|uniref:hypothetical protein n=1 Tax=Methylorubrum aminovorans TaxID=269069 RepID=UPI003C2D6CF5